MSESDSLSSDSSDSGTSDEVQWIGDNAWNGIINVRIYIIYVY